MPPSQSYQCGIVPSEVADHAQHCVRAKEQAQPTGAKGDPGQALGQAQGNTRLMRGGGRNGAHDAIVKCVSLSTAAGQYGPLTRLPFMMGWLHSCQEVGVLTSEDLTVTR